ncbi:DUF2550 family protein [Georgenia yuyongxinii]|uniref:DUF2550 family protein n=1 Tax=Georgenia yuyongxinii TaxID=2589797 RepID=A0A5B8C5W7_9MICO|nr:DUF2550 family protein [Georgenia yuyongxinii]QDC25470.1 DUF2550 family protein [Georgenia yuyongxinii]
MTGAGAGWGTLAVLALVLVVVAIALYAVRVRRIANRVGSFECALRRTGAKDWTSGIACYGAGRVYWYRLVSVRLTPSRTLARDELVVLARERRPGAGHVIEARVSHRGEVLEIAMVREAFAGLVSWLEAAPPRGEPRL